MIIFLFFKLFCNKHQNSFGLLFCSPLHLTGAHVRQCLLRPEAELSLGLPRVGVALGHVPFPPADDLPGDGLAWSHHLLKATDDLQDGVAPPSPEVIHLQLYQLDLVTSNDLRGCQPHLDPRLARGEDVLQSGHMTLGCVEDSWRIVLIKLVNKCLTSRLSPPPLSP